MTSADPAYHRGPGTTGRGPPPSARGTAPRWARVGPRACGPRSRRTLRGFGRSRRCPSQAEGRAPRGDDGPLPSARATARPREVPGVVRPAVHRVERLEPNPAFRHVRRADHDGSRGAQPGYGGRVGGADGALSRDQAAGLRCALDREELLDRAGDAEQRRRIRAPGQALVGEGRLVPGPLEARVHDRVERRVDALDPSNGRLDELDARDASLAQPTGEVDGRRGEQISLGPGGGRGAGGLDGHATSLPTTRAASDAETVRPPAPARASCGGRRARPKIQRQADGVGSQGARRKARPPGAARLGRRALGARGADQGLQRRGREGHRGAGAHARARGQGRPDRQLRRRRHPRGGEASRTSTPSQRSGRAR
jgi:hypothetical protein